MPEPESAIEYVAYPRGPQFNRKEAAEKLLLLHKGYFSLWMGKFGLSLQILATLCLGSFQGNIILFAQIATGILTFNLVVGALSRIGLALHWKRSSYFALAALYTVIPSLWVFLLNWFVYGLAVFLTAQILQMIIGYRVRRELALYGIRLRGIGTDAQRENLREDIAKLEAGPPTPPSPYQSIADHAEIG